MRYFMLGSGSSLFRRRSASAFLPGLPRTPKASTYGTVYIVGHPGDLPIPSPRPAAAVPISQNRLTQPSRCSPDVFYPSIYYTTPVNMHPPVSLFRDNQLPVPAIDLYKFPNNPNFGAPLAGRLPRSGFRSRKVGGRQAPAWPPVVQTWPRLSQRYTKKGS